MKNDQLIQQFPVISADDAAKLIEENGATDRYQALGIPYPDPETMCKGPCEGTGIYPCKNDDDVTVLELVAWNDAHRKNCGPESDQSLECDGWHFIQCFECLGTGKATPETEN